MNCKGFGHQNGDTCSDCNIVRAMNTKHNSQDKLKVFGYTHCPVCGRSASVPTETWKEEFRKGFNKTRYEYSVDTPDDPIYPLLSYCEDFISSLLSSREKEIDSMKVSTRTWGKFFKNTSFEHNNDSHSIDIKCAYTNGYNKALEDVIEKLK